MKALLFLLLSFQLSACVKVTSLSEDSQNEDNERIQAQSVSLAVPTIEARNEPNSYWVHVPFPEGASIVHRYEKANPSALTNLPLNLKSGILTDNQVKSGTSYVYQMGYLHNGNFQELKSYEVTVPIDLVIDQETVLKENTDWNQYQRIFLTRNGKVATQGFDLNIEADRIISDNGLIQSFPDGAQSPEGIGRGGGSVQIRTRTGEGIVRIEMRGQKGGVGLKGPSHPGHPVSACGQIIRLGPMIDVPISHGRKGNPGLTGFPGGNSGSAEIEILEEHSLYFQPVIQAGPGGQGGPGGDGECSRPAFEIPGPPGDLGVEGPSGIREKICIRDSSNHPCWE